ncbi:MAG: hypothetical protein MUF42_15575 [Cytophagaceae bacterium]|jgi:hypothetical protein|nr:hypothetical protein [Cytophagaceae bacterium]
MDNNSFRIQINNPILINPVNKQYEQISSAIQNIFPMNTEYLIFYWNRIPIRLEYKYDLCVIFDDILYMLKAVTSDLKGQWRVGWGSDSFRGEWKMKWDQNILRINSRWDSIIGEHVDSLNRANVIELDLTTFICEWKILLNKIIESFDKNEIVITKEMELLKLMLELENKIPQFGKLYNHLN